MYREEQKHRMKPRRTSFRDKKQPKSRRLISTVGLRARERACVFVVTGCGVSDRVGRTTGVEITPLFAWATAVICFVELCKS